MRDAHELRNRKNISTCGHRSIRQTALEDHVAMANLGLVMSRDPILEIMIRFSVVASGDRSCGFKEVAKVDNCSVLAFER